MRRAGLPLLVLALAPACGLIGSGDDRGAAVTVTARKAVLRISVPAEGYLEATEAKPMAVPRVPTGALKVKEVVEEGSLVEEGQVVVVFDDTELNIQLSNHQASFTSANLRINRNSLQSDIEAGSIDVMKKVAELERDHVDAFQLVNESLYSRQEILESAVRKDVAEETIVFAKASLLLRGEYYDIEERILGVDRGQSEGNIGRIETSLGNLVLKAPLGGLIVYKKNWRGATVAVGDTLWPGNVIMSIVDPDSTALNAFVLERDAAGIEVDDEARVRIDAYSAREFRGKVTNVAKLSRPIERGSPVKYFEVTVELQDAEPGLLKPGMKGKAWIETGQIEEMVVVPRSALRGDSEAPFVLVESADGPARREVVVAGGDLVQVAIREGLEGGEQVLLGDVPLEDELAPGAGGDAGDSPVVAATAR